MAAWQDDGDLAVGVDLLSEDYRQQAVFGEDLGARGILPVQLLLVNRASQPGTVRRSEIQLELADGTQLHPIEPSAIAGSRPGRGGGSEGAGGMCVILPLCAVALVLVVGALIGAAVAPATEAARDAQVREYLSNSFPPTTTLEKDLPVHGFVFFALQEGTPAAAAEPTGFGNEPVGHRLPPPHLRATVANMAGARPPRSPAVLHIQIEDLPESRRLDLRLRPSEVPGRGR